MRIFNLPLKTKSNNVPRFCGLGEVTKMFEYPKPTAAAIASPNAADLPRPPAAVRETVRSSFLSVIASMNSKRLLAWSIVLHKFKSFTNSIPKLSVKKTC